jgi:hypothetical protein
MKVMRWLAALLSFRGSTKRFRDGSLIRYVNRDNVQYLEMDGRIMDVEAYLTDEGPVDRVIVRKCLERWSPPHQTDVISAAKQDEILAKVRSYFDEVGITYRIDPDLPR